MHAHTSPAPLTFPAPTFIFDPAQTAQLRLLSYAALTLTASALATVLGFLLAARCLLSFPS